MKRISLIIGIISLAFALAVISAAAKADFSGSWEMDKAKSEGVPADMEQTMTVTQTGDTVNVETKIKSAQGELAASASYVLDGKEAAYTQKRGEAEGKGKRTSKWTSDTNGFEVTEEEKYDTPNGEVVIQISRKWAMQADGKTLVIELNFKTPNGEQHSKRTFVKK